MNKINIKAKDIRSSLGQVFSPAVISDQDKGVLRTDHLRAVSAKLFLMVFPDPAVELSGRLELGLKMQVKITDRIQAHDYLCCFCLFLSAFTMSIIFQGKFQNNRVVVCVLESLVNILHICVLDVV